MFANNATVVRLSGNVNNANSVKSSGSNAVISVQSPSQLSTPLLLSNSVAPPPATDTRQHIALYNSGHSPVVSVAVATPLNSSNIAAAATIGGSVDDGDDGAMIDGGNIDDDDDDDDGVHMQLQRRSSSALSDDSYTSIGSAVSDMNDSGILTSPPPPPPLSLHHQQKQPTLSQSAEATASSATINNDGGLICWPAPHLPTAGGTTMTLRTIATDSSTTKATTDRPASSTSIHCCWPDEAASRVSSPLQSTDVFGSMGVASDSATPYSDATRTKKHKINYVKRPMNAFMVFSQLERVKLIASGFSHHNAVISKELGSRWKLLNATDKQPYVDEAKRLKVLHQLEYPDYKYRPQKKRRKTTDGQAVVVASAATPRPIAPVAVGGSISVAATAPSITLLDNSIKINQQQSTLPYASIRHHQQQPPVESILSRIPQSTAVVVSSVSQDAAATMPLLNEQQQQRRRQVAFATPHAEAEVSCCAPTAAVTVRRMTTDVNATTPVFNDHNCSVQTQQVTTMMLPQRLPVVVSGAGGGTTAATPAATPATMPFLSQARLVEICSSSNNNNAPNVIRRSDHRSVVIISRPQVNGSNSGVSNDIVALSRQDAGGTAFCDPMTLDVTATSAAGEPVVSYDSVITGRDAVMSPVAMQMPSLLSASLSPQPMPTPTQPEPHNPVAVVVAGGVVPGSATHQQQRQYDVLMSSATPCGQSAVYLDAATAASSPPTARRYSHDSASTAPMRSVSEDINSGSGFDQNSVPHQSLPPLQTVTLDGCVEFCRLPTADHGDVVATTTTTVAATATTPIAVAVASVGDCGDSGTSSGATSATSVGDGQSTAAFLIDDLADLSTLVS